MKCTFKVAVIGMGNVGATAAYSMLLSKIPTDLVLFAHHREKAEGEKLDLEHALPFLEHTNIIATDSYADVAGSDLVVITAGAPQKPGQSRLDLVKENLAVLGEIIPPLYAASPESVVLIVSNPVDILTYHATQLAPFKPGQVFGSGTLLDTARFRFYLSELFSVNPRSIHAYILGEHGDHSFPALSTAHIGGQPMVQFPQYNIEKIQDAYMQTKNAAANIIQAKGATYYAIATVITKIMEMIYSDASSIMPATVPLEADGWYGNTGMSISVPCVVGRTGVKSRLKLELSPDEQAKLAEAVNVLKDAYNQAK